MRKKYIKYNSKTGRVDVIYKRNNEPPSEGGWTLAGIPDRVDINSGNRPSFNAIWIADLHPRAGSSEFQTRWPIFLDKVSEIIEQRNPEHVIFTGDIFDSLGNTTTHATELIYVNQLKERIAGIPTTVCRGNHDPLGTLSELMMPSNYFFVDVSDKWRLISLYSQQEGDYTIGATQRTFLTSSIESAGDRNICIMSHVPMCGSLSYLWYVYHYKRTTSLSSDWNVTVDLHRDIYPLMEIFRTHPNVKASLYGHEHMYEEWVYPAFNNMKFFNGGAVCGDWWNNSTDLHEKFNYQGFNFLKFYDNGNVEREIIYF